MHKHGLPVDVERRASMKLCEIGGDGSCVACGRPMRNANAKRHCYAYAEKTALRPCATTTLLVGTTLSAILSFFGMQVVGACSCKSLRRQMDMLGAKGCWRGIRRLSAELSLSARKAGYYCPMVCSYVLIVFSIVAAAASGCRKSLAP